jgi:hypothetical protein
MGVGSGNNQGKFRNMGEPEIVEAEPLASILRRFCVNWLKEYPQENNSQVRSKSMYGEKGVYFMGPIQYISEKSGIDPRRISGMCNGEFPRVGLTQADAVLAAINMNHLLMAKEGETPEIPIKPNPQWSMEKYQEYMAERGCI